MRKIVSSFVVGKVTVNLIKPNQKFCNKNDKEQLAKYLYKLLEMGYSK